MNKETKYKALRTECVVLKPEAEQLKPEQMVEHVVKFDWNETGEKWSVLHRLTDCLAQGRTVILRKIDPRVERLARKFKCDVPRT